MTTTYNYTTKVETGTHFTDFHTSITLNTPLKTADTLSTSGSIASEVTVTASSDTKYYVTPTLDSSTKKRTRRTVSFEV